MAFALRYVYRTDLPIENLAGGLAQHLACSLKQGQVVCLEPVTDGTAVSPAPCQTRDMLVSWPGEGENGDTAPSISLWADGRGQLFMEVRLERKALRAFNPALDQPFNPALDPAVDPALDPAVGDGEGRGGTVETSLFWYHRAADQFLRAQGASPVAEVRDMVIADW